MPRLFAVFALLLAVGCGGKASKPDGSTNGDGGTSSDGGLTGDGGTTECDVSLRECAHVFSWTFTAGATQPARVEVRGTFNDWQAGKNPMTYANGVWTATVELPWDANVEYKFWAQWDDNLGNPLWSTDPSAPTAADGNSVLSNVECSSYTCIARTPVLELVAPPSTTAASYELQVKFVPGTAELDPAKTVITVNGAIADTSTVTYDATAHLFHVTVTSGVTKPNKYGYVFSITDLAGVSARLFVPFWVEDTTFEWKDAFMYEVMTDRFFHGGTSMLGPNGPPTEAPGEWKGGDFGGVTAKINAGYFDQMGVNALWISSPVVNTTLCEVGVGANSGHCLGAYHSYFPMATGWTYGSEKDPVFAGFTDPIDPHFGSSADLKALVNAAHAHGIRVLTDLVVNHVFADSAPPKGQTAQLAPLWTAHSTDTTWFNVPYNASTNDCGNENLWDVSTSQQWNRTTCWFDPYLPDFNTSSTAVDRSIAEHAAWLMQTFDLDGFRVDAAKQVMRNVAVALRAKLSSIDSTSLPIYLVGEALGGDVDNVMDCVGADAFDGSMNDPLHNSIVSTFLYGSENPNDFDNDVQYDEATWTGRYAQALMGHFFGSHDVPRAISEAAGANLGDPWNNAPPAQETNPTAFQRLAMAQAFLLTYDSLPILWMGDEFGQPGAIDPDNRRTMRFDGALSAQEVTALDKLRTLGSTRLAHSALRRGNRTRLYVSDSFYAYARTEGSDVAIAAFNFGTSAQTITLVVTPINLTGTVTDVLTGTSATVSQGNLVITVPPLSAAVYTR
ncbi:MAG: alpha-amylase family glycosyl hydrolase [Polyangia bacterium]